MDSFFGIGIFELVMIAVIALIVMGPERLPGAMRELAKYMKQLRAISSEFQNQFSDELQMLDEINPKRIFDSTLDTKPSPATRTNATGKTPTPAIGGVAAKPLAGSSQAPVNTILPPPVAEAPVDSPATPPLQSPTPLAAPTANPAAEDSPQLGHNGGAEAQQ
ncbi:MAG: twin-arginine translocase subunit TatB [Anaerolineales bacterium]|nr:twin-arginine translocase subunit TatB [Anaerolineales bacterium]